MGYYKRLRELREENTKTQTQVAEMLKMKQQQYLRYEKGDRDTSTELLIAIAKIYNVSVDYILGLTDERTPYPPSSKD